MKNKEFLKLLKLLNKNQANSGFTLMELLVGLVMSVVVIGALGFGLVQVLRITQAQTSEENARNEISRALDFIADEVKRARTIETDLVNANISGTGAFNITNTNIDSATGGLNSNTTTNKKIVFALDIPEISSSDSLDSDKDDTTTNERIIYFLKSSSGTNWEGPLVLYRWGPPLGADGSYETGGWQEEALIDGIDDTHIANNPCGADVPTPPLLTGTAPTLTGTYISSFASGFYACINGTNTAQLYLVAETDTETGSTETYTADTRVAARARIAPANNTDTFTSYTMSYKTLGAEYNCTPGDGDGDGINDGTTWDMRTDFVNSSTNIVWVHQDVDRQPQPIKIDTNSDLVITSTPVGLGPCLSNGNPGTTGDESENLSDYGYNVSYTMKFMKDTSHADYNANDWYTFNGDPETGTRDVPDVKGDGSLMVYKNNSTIDTATLSGYDFDDDGTADQESLGAFLEGKGYATDNGDGTYTVKGLENNERIIAVEVGQTDPTHPGFDAQDSVFILSSDVFAKKY